MARDDRYVLGQLFIQLCLWLVVVLLVAFIFGKTSGSSGKTALEAEGYSIDVEGIGKISIESEGRLQGIEEVTEGRYELDWGKYQVYLKGIDFEVGGGLPKLTLEVGSGTDFVELQGTHIESDEYTTKLYKIELYTTELYKLSSRDEVAYELEVDHERVVGDTLYEAITDYDSSEVGLKFDLVYVGVAEKDVITWSIEYEPYTE